MKFETEDKVVYCKDNSYKKEYDNTGWHETNHIQYYKGYLVHREDEPAIIYTNGHKLWLFEGKYHRDDGPAMEFSYGDKEWYLNNKEYSEKEYWKMMNLMNKNRVLNEI